MLLDSISSSPRVKRSSVFLQSSLFFQSGSQVDHKSLVALLCVKRFYVAFKAVRCYIYVLPWCAFSPSLSFSCFFLARGWDAFLCAQSQYLARHLHADSLLCYTIVVRMPEMYVSCMLDYAAVLFVFTCFVVRALEFFCLCEPVLCSPVHA